MRSINLKVRQATIVILLFLYMVVNFADKAVLGIVAIPMMKELNLSPAQFGMIASSFFFLYSISGIAFGFLADKFKAKTLLALLALSWAITQFPIAWWASLPVLLICRILLGVGEGPAYPVAVHAAYKWFPDNQRNVVTAILAQSGPTGLMVAAPILSLLLVEHGWRSAFLMLGVSGLVWVLFWLVLGGEGQVGASETKAGESVVAAEPKLPYRKLLLDRTMIGSMTGAFAAYWILVMGFTWLPPYLNIGLGYSVVNAGWLVSVIMGCSVPLQLATAWISQRWLQRGASSRVARGMLMGGFITLSGLFVVGAMLLSLGPVTRIVFLALGCALPLVAFSIAPTIIGEISPSSQRGALLAVNISVANLAGLIAPAVTGWIVQSAASTTVGYTYGYLFAGGILIVGGLIAVILIDPVGSRARLQAGEGLSEAGKATLSGVSPAR
jgi:MFS family permease